MECRLITPSSLRHWSRKIINGGSHEEINGSDHFPSDCDGDLASADCRLDDGAVARGLRGVRLVEVDLYECNLEKCDLRDADLTHANLEKTRLAGADLRGANVEGIDLAVLDLRGVRLDVAEAVALARALGARVE